MKPYKIVALGSLLITTLETAFGGWGRSMPREKDREMIGRDLASAVSYLISPPVWLLILFPILISQAGLSSPRLWLLLIISLFLQIIIPVSYLYLGVRFHKISAWDVPIRSQRYTFLGVILGCGLIWLGLVYQMGTSYLFQLSMLFFILMAALAGITLFWKVSFHSAATTAGALILNFIFGWHLWWLYLLIPLVCWSRLLLKRHTPAQLLAGIVVSGGVILIGLQLLGYL